MWPELATTGTTQGKEEEKKEKGGDSTRDVCLTLTARDLDVSCQM
jgi:hypothetical protein